MTLGDAGSTRRPAPVWVLLAAFAVLVVGFLVWSKWGPYSVKLPQVADSGSLGESIVTDGRAAPPAVSLEAGLDFAVTYFQAIWPALVAGLVIAAGVQVLVPQDWLCRLFGPADGSAGALRGAALAVPSMMCTCCAAPIAVGLRRRAASLGSALAYWLGNPALNPVVLAFCAFVLPWPWTLLRAGAGVAVVVVGAVAVGRLFARRVQAGAGVGHTEVEQAVEPDAAGEGATDTRRPVAIRFAASLGGLTLRLVPEYAVIVVALGAFRGALFPLGTAIAVGVVGVLVLAVAGTLLPVPTGAEVAVIAAMLAVGVAGPVAAALLITLPTVSLPSLLMVRRAFGARLLAAVTGVVVVAGVLTAGVASLVGL